MEVHVLLNVDVSNMQISVPYLYVVCVQFPSLF